MPTPPPYVRYAAIHSFTREEGGHPRAGVIEGGDGRLYGTCWQCGPNGGGDAEHSCSSNYYWGTDEQRKNCPGSLFRLARNGSGFEIVHAFTRLSADNRNDDGYQPASQLARGPGNTIWGVAPKGGKGFPGTLSGGQGTLYSFLTDFDPIAGFDFAAMHQFGSQPKFADGSTPYGAPMFDGAQAFYGATASGGAASAGVIYKHGTDGSHTAVYTFIANDPLGSKPYSSPILHNGKLYGVTPYGGANNGGVLYEIDASSGVGRALHAFPRDTWTGNRDNAPLQNLIVGKDGKIYGAQEFGGTNQSGFIFRFDPALPTPTVQVLHNFAPCTVTTPPFPRLSNAEGALPVQSLLWGKDGNLFGTTFYGGAFGTGGIFQLRPDGSQFVLLHSFEAGATNSGGNYAYSALCQAADGYFYGTTYGGGGNGFGTVFKMDPPLSFLPVTVDPGVEIESEPIRVTCTNGSQLKITSGECSVNERPWATLETVAVGDTVKLRGKASLTLGARVLVNAQWGSGPSGSFVINTRR